MHQSLASIKRLTPRQGEVLAFIIERLLVDHRTPTIAEIGERFALKSTNGVDQHLKRLAAKGYVRRPEARHRGLKVLRHPDGRAFELRAA